MSSISTAVGAGSISNEQTFVQRNAVSLFFVLAFVLTWAVQIPIVLDARGMLPFHIPGIFQLVQGPMPGIAALILAALASGKAGVKDLLRRVVRWRVGAKWYIFAVFGTAALYFCALALSTLLGAPAPYVPSLSLLLFGVFLLRMTIYLVFNWEDLGWRGFAFTRMQATQSALKASLILGVVEGLFHVPLFFAPTSDQAASPFWAFLLWSVAGVIVINWLFNNTRGSVLLAMLMHAAANTWTDIVPFPANSALPWVMVGLLYTALAIVIVVVFGARYLARKPRPDQIIVTDPIAA